MGDPKYPRRVWRKPKRPLDYNLKVDELKTLGSFGLRTKRELWKARTELSRLRQQARSLLALGEEIRQEREPVLLNSLAKIGLVKPDAGLDDVLNLKVHDVLGRRLQSIVTKSMDFKTPYQARQAVIHGHIMIGQRIVDIPSYTVTVDEEKDIRLVPGSTLADVLAANKKSAEEAASKTSTEEGDDAAAVAGDADPGAAHGMQKIAKPEHTASDVPAEGAKSAQDDSSSAKAEATGASADAPAPESKPDAQSSQS